MQKIPSFIRFFIVLFVFFGNCFYAFSQNEQPEKNTDIYSKNIQANDSIDIRRFDSIPNGTYWGYYASDTTKPAFVYEKLNNRSSLIIFWQNGKIKRIGQYKTTVLSGTYLSAYESGLMAERGSYKSGEKNHIWKYWNTDGALVKQVKYKNGKKEMVFEKNNFSSLKLSKIGFYVSSGSSYYNFGTLNNELQQFGFKNIFPARIVFGGGLLYGNTKSLFASLGIDFDLLANSETPYLRSVFGSNYSFLFNYALLKKQNWSLIPQLGIVNINQKFNFYAAKGIVYYNSTAMYIGNGMLRTTNNWALKAGFEMDIDKPVFFSSAVNSDTGTSVFFNAGVYVPISKPLWREGNQAVLGTNPVLFNGFYAGLGICFL
ncbi:MAG: hypothetical protein ABI199_09975 [Bacteroidia bacterium]